MPHLNALITHSSWTRPGIADWDHTHPPFTHLKCSYFHTPSSWPSGGSRILSMLEQSDRIFCWIYWNTYLEIFIINSGTVTLRCNISRTTNWLQIHFKEQVCVRFLTVRTSATWGSCWGMGGNMHGQFHLSWYLNAGQFSHVHFVGSPWLLIINY